MIDHQVEDVVGIDEFLDELPLFGEVFFRRPGRAAKRALRAHALQTFLSGPKSFDWPRLRQHIAGLRLGWLRLLGGGRRLRSLREPRRLGHSHRFPVWLVGDEDRGAQPCPSSTAHRQPSPLMGRGALLYRIQSWRDISALGRQRQHGHSLSWVPGKGSLLEKIERSPLADPRTRAAPSEVKALRGCAGSIDCDD